MAGSLSGAFPETSRLLPVRTLPKIRLDRAQRQTSALGASVGNFSTFWLFNNSPQSHLLVVRGFHWGPAATGQVGISYGGVPNGTVVTTPNQPVLQDRGILPGQLFNNAIAFQASPDFNLFLQSLEQAVSGEYPTIVVTPNHSVVVQPSLNNTALTVSFLWEALTPDEFTEMYGEYA